MTTFVDDGPPVRIDQSKCTGCELCVYACPQQVLQMRADIARLAGKVAWVANADSCTGCAQCEDVCPDLCVKVSAVAQV